MWKIKKKSGAIDNVASSNRVISRRLLFFRNIIFTEIENNLSFRRTKLFPFDILRDDDQFSQLQSAPHVLHTCPSSASVVKYISLARTRRVIYAWRSISLATDIKQNSRISRQSDSRHACITRAQGCTSACTITCARICGNYVGSSFVRPFIRLWKSRGRRSACLHRYAVIYARLIGCNLSRPRCINFRAGFIYSCGEPGVPIAGL